MLASALRWLAHGDANQIYSIVKNCTYDSLASGAPVTEPLKMDRTRYIADNTGCFKRSKTVSEEKV